MQEQNKIKFTEFITQKKNNKGENLTPNTIKNYISQYNSIFKSFKSDKPNFVNNPDNVFKVLEKEFSNIHSLKLKINIVLLILECFFTENKNYTENKKIYNEYLIKIWDLIKENQESGEPTEKQVNKALSKEENELIINTLKKKLKYSIKTQEDLEILKQYIIYMIYDKYKLRGDISTSLFILSKDINKMKDKTNYIIINKDNKEVYYYQVDYKTKKTYKDNKIALPNDLYKYIVKLFNYYTKMKIKNKSFLYQKDLKTPMNTNNFSKFYSNIGLSTIGKITSLQINRIQDSSEDIEAIQNILSKAKNQQHSAQTHITTYAKKGLKSKIQ